MDDLKNLIENARIHLSNAMDDQDIDARSLPQLREAQHYLREAADALEAAQRKAQDPTDTERLDWLSDPINQIGNVQLPAACVLRNPHSLRAAIDDAMKLCRPTNDAAPEPPRE